MERVRKEHLNWLYQEKARLEKVNDDLLEEIHKHARRETELGENLEKMMNYTHEILEIHEKMMKDYEKRYDRVIKAAKAMDAFSLSLIYHKKE